MWGCNHTGVGIEHWFFGGGIIGLAITILIIIASIALIFRLVKHNQLKCPENFDKNDSLKILEIRFAKGDIDEQEFQKKKDILCH